MNGCFHIRYSNLKDSVSSNKEGHFILIKRAIHPEDRIALKIYVPNKSFKIHGGKKFDRNRQTPNHG